MPKQDRRCLMVSACLLLASCGTGSPSGSEQVAQRQGRLALPPQVSAAFAVDDSQPTLDLNAALLNVTGSTGGGYLLTYRVDHSPAQWSRSELAFVSGIPSIPLFELVFVQWNVDNGAPRTLARLHVATPINAQTVDTGGGWLVVYQVSTDNGFEGHAMLLARDGSLTPPTDLPMPCMFSALTRGGDSVLVADICGAGLLLDLSGQLKSSLIIATLPNPSYDYMPPSAFNGIDYLVDYGVYQYPPPVPRNTFGVPITPTGSVGTQLVLATPRMLDAQGFVLPFDLAVNGNAFLTLLSQTRGMLVSGTDSSYQITTEAADHTFTLGAERYLPGGPNSTSSAPSDLGATALALDGHFVIARTKSAGETELIYPSLDPSAPDSTQPLTLGLPTTAAPFVSTDSQSSDGTRLAFVSDARGVRVDASLQVIDAPPAELVKGLHQQFMPSFAFAGQHYFAVWAEGGFDTAGAITNIFGRRLSANGTLLDATSVQLNSGQHRNTDPLVVGTPLFFATLTNDYYADSALVTNVESPVATTAPGPLTSPDGIAVTTNGDSLIAAFYDHDGYSIKLRKLSATGTWADAVILTDFQVNEHSRIAVVFGGNQYLVLWTSTGDPGQRVVYGARASSEFALLDDPPKELLRFNCPDTGVDGRSYDSGLQLIASGDHFLFSWADVTDGTEALHIARLSKDLDLLDANGVLVGTQPFPQTLVSTRRVALGWDGSNDWVVWRDNEGGARVGLARLRGRRFSDALSPVDADSFLISSDLDELSKVTLAVGDGGRSLVGYTRLSSDYSYRVQARFLSSATFPDAVPCNDASQCQNGFCASGFCSSAAGAGGSGAGGSGGAVGGTQSTNGSTGGTSGGNESIGGARSESGGSGYSVAGAAGELAGGGPIVGGGGGTGDAGSGRAGETGSAPMGEGGGRGKATGDAGATESGASQGGADAGRAGSAASSSSAGSSGIAGLMAPSGDRPTGNHGCSMRSGASPSSRANLAALAGVLSALSWLGQRRRRTARRVAG